MNIQPIKKELYEQAKKLEIKEVILQFSGGSDEGFLDIEFNPDQYGEEAKKLAYRELYKGIEEWVWDVYDYSGAGDGTPYGDTITYSLENDEVTTNEWYTVTQSGDSYSDTLETR